MSDWQVYILRCRGGELYTGITRDVTRRLGEHSSGRGAKALRGRGPLSLVAEALAGSRSQAQQVEARIKRLPKQEKERLAQTPEMLHTFVQEVLQQS